MSVIAIDLGGTKALGAVFTKEGALLAKRTCFLEGAEGEEAGRIVLGLINRLSEDNPDDIVEAVGICVPGIVYHEDGCVWAPNIPGWEHYPLRSRIEDALGKRVLVVIESDRACYVLGEVWKGAARGYTDAVYIAAGTGIGIGILTEGHVIRGHSDIAGAAGWMALSDPFREEYRQCGCFESFASGGGIGNQIRRAVREHPDYSGVLSCKPIDELSSYDAFEYYDSDPLAKSVLDKAVEMWGMGAANIVSLLNPEIVVFGGGIFGPAARFLDRIHEEACKWGQPIAMKDVRFAVSELPGEAALYGAARLVLRNGHDN